jgi:hypothetical protein
MIRYLPIPTPIHTPRSITPSQYRPLTGNQPLETGFLVPAVHIAESQQRRDLLDTYDSPSPHRHNLQCFTFFIRILMARIIYKSKRPFSYLRKLNRTRLTEQNIAETDRYGLGLDVVVQSSLSELAADARLAVTTERKLGLCQYLK